MIGVDNEVDRQAVGGPRLGAARRWTPVFLRLESGLRTASRFERARGVSGRGACLREEQACARQRYL
jgi:hypothetical protein